MWDVLILFCFVLSNTEAEFDPLGEGVGGGGGRKGGVGEKEGELSILNDVCKSCKSLNGRDLVAIIRKI